MSKDETDVLVIKNRRIPVKIRDLPQHELKYYLENPRLYTLVRGEGKEPTQEEIEETLIRMDHVKELAQSIKDNGGLMDAIFVHEKTMVVLEGNSRLAAYRLLARHDAVKWGAIRARVLPATITEREIFTLLGQYHIIGKKDWVPFEQAGYLYRQHVDNKVPIPELSKEISMSARAISHLISVVEFMNAYKEKDVSRWSYYDEYLKSNKLKKARSDFPELDKLVVRKIKSGEIPRAVDVRDDLKRIVEVGGRVLSNFVDEKRDFAESVQAAIDKGGENHEIRQLKRFKEWIAATETKEDLTELDGATKKECIYDLKKIHTIIGNLLKKME